MAEPDTALPPEVSAAIAREVEAACRRYRVTAEQAHRAFHAAFAADPALIDAFRARHATEDVTRLRAYREAVKRARKDIYYQLRQYRREGDTPHEALAARLAAQVQGSAPAEAIRETCRALLATHASTRERDHAPFYDALFALVPPPASVLDLGCGLQPLAYPFGVREGVCYVALDRDPSAIAVLRAFAPAALPARLVALQADLAALDWRDALACGVARFDLALMLKLVPVVRRQQRDLLPFLADAPAHRLLITGNVESLTRHESIKGREDRALRDFIALSNRRVIGHFRAGGEFGYLLE
mgnify:CR=1 FL=1